MWAPKPVSPGNGKRDLLKNRRRPAERERERDREKKRQEEKRLGKKRKEREIMKDIKRDWLGGLEVLRRHFDFNLKAF